jgi:hypothetical protein
MTDTQNQENPPEFDREPPQRTSTPGYDDEQRGAGISNRPVEEEQENQDRLPPRGQPKD